MCLSFFYTNVNGEIVVGDEDHAAAAAAAQAALDAAKKDHNVDCSNIQITIITHLDDSMSVFCLMPIKIKDTESPFTMVMFPLAKGSAAKFTSCDPLPCKAANLDRWHNPGTYVKKPKLEPLMYRSLQAAEPPLELPESTCIKNTDGSKLFVLHTSDYVKSDKELEASGIGKEAHLEEMRKACFDALVKSMRANEVDETKIFRMSEDDDKTLHPEAMVNFMDELYPNLRPNNDVVVCIPPMKKDEPPATEFAFSFCFRYEKGDESRNVLPIPGLVHNIDHTTPDSKQKVEGNFYIVSNTSPMLHIKDEETPHEKIDVVLEKGVERLPFKKSHMQGGVTDDEAQPVWRSLEVPPEVPPEVENEEDDDLHAWMEGCEQLQQLVEADYWKKMSDFCQGMTPPLPDFDTRNFYSANLKDLYVYKNATSVVVDYSTSDRANAHKGTKQSRATESEDSDVEPKRQALNTALIPLELAAMHIQHASSGNVELVRMFCSIMNPEYVFARSQDSGDLLYGIDTVKMTPEHTQDLLKFVSFLVVRG